MASQANPLLEIDTDFSHYVAARTKSGTAKQNLLGGKLDYIFDSDVDCRRKLNNMSGINKVMKPVFPFITERYRTVVGSAARAGALKYGDAYKIMEICASRLGVAVPSLFVTVNSSEYRAYSFDGGDISEPCIVITSAVAESLSKDEIAFLIGRECGRIQNGHSVFKYAAAYYGQAGADSDRRDTITDTGIKNVLRQWLRYSDVTCDRAGIICMDSPDKYAEAVLSSRREGNLGLYPEEKISAPEMKKLYEKVHFTPARSINIGADVSELKRRILCGMEFISCEVLYSRRSDLPSAPHTMNKQGLEVRCDIIIG
ncbi:MAG: M48 family metalloprotease [Ruminococcus sp.]|jgi:hypothetical protein|nr:M48 family metalloprotease [Ruminococcus sp.]